MSPPEVCKSVGNGILCSDRCGKKCGMPQNQLQRGIEVKKTIGAVLLFILLCAVLSFYGGIGDKSASVSAVYGTTVVLSLAAIIGYGFLVRQKVAWFSALFTAVFVVNMGYFALSISRTLEAALWANRLAYLGSVFLPLSMLMIILNTCKMKYSHRLPAVLLAVSTGVFLIAASPGVLDIYYKDVSLSVVNGATVLEKVYGPCHRVYLFYLLAYFFATAAAIFHACASGHLDSALHAVFMSAAVFANMGVWLLEQIVRIDFELLSVSYIVTEVFLLLLCLLQQSARDSQGEGEEDRDDVPAGIAVQASDESRCAAPVPDQQAIRTLEEQCAYFEAQRIRLTPTERVIYDFYLEGKSTKEIMAELNIKENTLKYHNKNIYGKLGVSSRKQLVMIASMLEGSPEA